MDSNTSGRWWRVIIFGASAGMGLAIAAVAIALIVSWLQNRPEKDVWTTGGMTAEYSHFTVQTSDSYYVFYYTIHNPNDQDYSALNHSIVIDGRSNDGALMDSTRYFEVLEPIFIPSHDSAQIAIRFRHAFPLTVHETWGDEDGRKMLHAAELGHLNDELPRLSGLVLFDKTKKIRIELPGGWRQEQNPLK